MKNVFFKSKLIEGLTYYRVKGSRRYSNYLMEFEDKSKKEGYSELELETIGLMEISEYLAEERRIAAKKRKDEWDMNKFGRTF